MKESVNERCFLLIRMCQGSNGGETNEHLQELRQQIAGYPIEKILSTEVPPPDFVRLCVYFSNEIGFMAEIDRIELSEETMFSYYYAHDCLARNFYLEAAELALNAIDDFQEMRNKGVLFF